MDGNLILGIPLIKVRGSEVIKSKVLLHSFSVKKKSMEHETVQCC